MKFFLDSVDLREVEAAAAWGIIDGVTTNPGLLARSESPVAELVAQICARVRGTVSVPAWGDDSAALVASGQQLAQLDDRVLVKIPVHSEGLQAMSRLHSQGIRCHATLCCSPHQALLAAKCGAYYVSPFVGRVEEAGGSGIELVTQIIEVYDNYEFETQVMVASMRNAAHVQDVALLGADACTLPWTLLQEITRHPQTEALVERERRIWDGG